MINSRCDRAKVYLGPFIAAIEKVVYSHPFGLSHSPFVKHVPVPERSSLISKLQQQVTPGRHAYLTDYTAFESHFTPSVLLHIECLLYEHCISWHRDAHLIATVIAGNNNMRTRTGCKARVQGRRMSGDVCTSLGNGFTNLMLAMFLCQRYGTYFDGYVEGDDGVFVTDAILTATHFANLGFTIKIQDLSVNNGQRFENSVCRAAFCGLVFSADGNVIRDPRPFLSGFGWTGSFIQAGPKIMQELLRAKALSACYETPQCPIVGALARRALQLTRGFDAREVLDSYHDALPDFNRQESSIPVFCPPLSARLLMQDLYSIPPDVQIACELAIMNDDYATLVNLLPPSFESVWYSQRYLDIT